MSETSHTPTPEEYLSMVKAEVNEETTDVNSLVMQLNGPKEALPSYLNRLLRDIEENEIKTRGWDEKNAQIALGGIDDFIEGNIEGIMSDDTPRSYREIRFHINQLGADQYRLVVYDNYGRGLLQRDALPLVPPPPVNQTTPPTT